MALPRNVQEVFELLVESGEPMSLSDVERALRANGNPLGIAQLSRLPEKFPAAFELTAAGLLTVTVEEAEHPPLPLNPGEWWRDVADVDEFDRARVLVVDLVVTEAAGPRRLTAWWLSDQHTPVAELVLDELSAPSVASLLGEAEALCAYLAHLAVVPELERILHAADVQFTIPPVLDLVELFVLLDPTVPERSLESFAEWLDADEANVAGVAVAALQRWRPLDATFELSRRVLLHAGSAWGQLLPGMDLALDPSLVLDFVKDPLIEPAPSIGFVRADDAVDEGFAALIGTGEHRRRPSQETMAREVATTFDRSGRIIVEAPTGTGKSLGYLIPACGSAPNVPVVISTATRMLQSQIRDDATRLRELGILGVPFRQLQGVNNYICARNVAEAFTRADNGVGAWIALAVAVRGLAATPGGIWDDVADTELRKSGRGYASMRNSLRTTSQRCARDNCEFASRCPMMHRLEGIDSQPGVLSVNHALLAKWLSDPEQPTAPGRLFSVDGAGSAKTAKPVRTALVIDEAHNLEDSLANAWASEVGAERLESMLGWLNFRRGPIRSAQQGAKKLEEDDAPFEKALIAVGRASASAERLGQAVAMTILEFGAVRGHVALEPFLSGRQQVIDLGAAARDLAGRLQALSGAIDGCRSVFSRSRGSGSAPKWIERVTRDLDAAIADIDDVADVVRMIPGPRRAHRDLDVVAVDSETSMDPEDIAAAWRFQRIPLQIARMCDELIVRRCDSMVLTSATLTVADAFTFTAQRLGLDISGTGRWSFETSRLPSPFDHDRNSMILLTDHLPVPTPANEREFVEDVAQDQTGFLSLSSGRALTLFASRRRMELVAELVRTKERELAERHVTLLVQGEMGPSAIATRFSDDPGTALFGVRTYWEGFDAPGETLSYLFVEKPPYPHPDDPLERARQRLLEEQGDDAFIDYVVPRTAVLLTQGVGRLIRSESDRGAAFIYDRRMLSPSRANNMLLSTLPTSRIVQPQGRDDAWRTAIEFVTGEPPEIDDALALKIDDASDLVDELRLSSTDDPEPGLRRAAALLFGIEELHDSQVQLMKAVIQGQDALGILPTGRGKSICFQLPALLHPNQLPFVVISPLVALIKDQLDDLRSRRGFRSVAGISGRTSATERNEVLRDLRDGRVRLLYVSPERFVRDPVLGGALDAIELGAVVVDEAHCISAWGHDFRPEFRLIANRVGADHNAPKLGLTATAPPEVENDIVTTLGMEDPLVVREPTDRPELAYWRVRCQNDRQRTREMLRFVMAQGGRPGIVYASRRAETERLAWVLRHAGFNARAYHAGLLPEQRESAQESFLDNAVQVIVATKAFGMGVNKADIGWVLHFDLPESLESYAQEAGRAARTHGTTATVALLWTGGDLRRRRSQARRSPLASAEVAQRVLALIRDAPRRDGFALIEPDVVAEQIEIDADELNVVIAWLEKCGTLERLTDATTRGVITLGRTEPDDQDERRRFLTWLKARLRCTMDSRRQISIDDAAKACGTSASELEDQLIRWSLDRHIAFNSSRRCWRIRVRSDVVDAGRLASISSQWRDLQVQRLDGMIAYAEGGGCRRAAIAREFGDSTRVCDDVRGLRCDVCDAGGPPWHSVPVSEVPDPEQFIDVRAVMLQAIAWASRRTERPLGEGTIEAMLLGNETIGGHQISLAALKCPQFGVLRHVRSAKNRYSTEMQLLMDAGLVERFEVEANSRTWWSIKVTPEGRAELGMNGGI